MSSNPYTEKEAEVHNSLIQAFNAFAELESTHPTEHLEFMHAIHSAQNILGWRILRRDYPETFISFVKDETIPKRSRFQDRMDEAMKERELRANAPKPPNDKIG